MKRALDTASRTLNARPGFPATVSTVSLTVKKQLDDNLKWAAAFYECGLGVPLEVASSSSQALRDAAEDTARLVRMPDDRFILAVAGVGAGKAG